MNSLQSVAGLLILIVGTFIGIASGNYFLVIISVTCGFLLMSLTKLLDINRDMNHRLLGIPLTNSQIDTIINHSTSYFVESSAFDVYPEKEAPYPLIILDNENYIRAKVFNKYLSQNEYLYTFEFPHETTIIDCSASYYKGVDLFEHEGIVFVKIAKLNLKLTIYKDRIILG